MSQHRFLDAIDQRVLAGDGAMGARCLASGMPIGTGLRRFSSIPGMREIIA